MEKGKLNGNVLGLSKAFDTINQPLMKLKVPITPKKLFRLIKSSY